MTSRPLPSAFRRALALWWCGAVALSAADAEGPIRLEPIDVFGWRSDYHAVDSESDLVGPAEQPEWTARRAFAETDIYVIPPGEIEFNQFYVSSHPRHGKPENLFESEFEFGLPWRTQFDVELNYRITDGRAEYASTLLELPHALADWGRLPLNPAINGGWRFNSREDDSWFVSVLLAEQFGRHLHFGADLAFERQIGGELETAYELTAAASYVVIDRKLALGAELLVEHELAHENEIDDEGEVERFTERTTSVLLGPTVLFKPTRRTHLGLVPLVGLTHDAPAVEAFFIFGLDLEPWASGTAGEESERPGALGEPVRRRR